MRINSGTRSKWWTLLFAIVITGLSIRLCFIPGLGPILPFGLVLLFAVVLSAYVGGLWPGLLSTVLGAAAAGFLLNRIVHLSSHTSINPQLIWSFAAVFLGMGTIVSFLFEALHRSRRSSDAAQRELAAILANINDAILTTNAAGRIEYLNQTAVVLLQCDWQQAIGQPFEAIVKIHDAVDVDRATSLIGRVRDTAHTVHIGSPQFLLRHDGKQVAVEATAAPVRNAAGEVVSVVVTLRDCSVQREVENVLHERLALQARFERIAAVVPGAIYEFRTDADGHEKLLYASPAFKEIFGVDPELFAQDATGFRAMVVPEDAGDVREFTETAAKELQSINVEQRVLTSHHGIRWVTVIATPVRQADGSTLWHGIFMDTTERKRAGERLRASQLHLQAAVDAGGMGIIAANFTDGTVELDATARRLWGLDAITERALKFEDLKAMIHPDSPSRMQTDLPNMQLQSQAINRQYRLLLKDGRERWLSSQGRVYRDEASGELVAVGVVMDITQNRLLEQQRLHSQKLEALGVLAGGIAHDFNNLLLAISGNANLLLADLSHNDPARTSVAEIHKAALRAADLVRRILNFSSVSELQQTGRAAVLRPVLDDVLAAARATLPASICLQANLPETLPNVRAEAGQVQQVLLNLLTNAADASVPVGGGNIVLSAAEVTVDETAQQRLPEVKQGRYVCIAVADAGKGIEPAILPLIFDPFFTTKTTGRGTGLGLAIVHGVMKSIDGAVTVSSTPGQGAMFSLYFPVAVETATVPATAPATPKKSTAHILYVDDEESLIFLMSRTLERMGHKVTACESPENALSIFTANPDDFDLVVSDMAMPVLTGIELAERILAVRPRLPFIITSGFVDAADAERAQQVGVRRMIMKPNTVEELSLAVAAVLREQDLPAATS